MDLKQLQAMGGISARSIVKREVPIIHPPLRPAEEWADPNTPESDDQAPKEKWTKAVMEVHVRKRSAADFYELLSADDRNKPLIVILRCICNSDGTPVFDSLEQVDQLKEWLWMPLAVVANEVNKLDPKHSQPKTSSGTKSRSSSAAPSRKRKSVSVRKNGKAGSPTATNLAPSIR